MSEPITTFSGFVCLDLKRFQLAEKTQKSKLADEINPALFLGSHATYEDSTGRLWACWRDSRFELEQLELIEFWMKNLEVMPVVTGKDVEKERELVKTEKETLGFKGDTDERRARIGTLDYMIVTEKLPLSWKPYEPEL